MCINSKRCGRGKEWEGRNRDQSSPICKSNSSWWKDRSQRHWESPADQRDRFKGAHPHPHPPATVQSLGDVCWVTSLPQSCGIWSLSVTCRQSSRRTPWCRFHSTLKLCPQIKRTPLTTDRQPSRCLGRSGSFPALHQMDHFLILEASGRRGVTRVAPLSLCGWSV